MEAAIKAARQYWWEQGDHKRVNFIARELSFHGNSLGTLSLGHHPGRRAPYEPILSSVAFHRVSPAYAFRYKKEDETDEEYVQRLADELDAKFRELGPDTVAACESFGPIGLIRNTGWNKSLNPSCRRNRSRCYYRLCPSPQRLFRRDEKGL